MVLALAGMSAFGALLHIAGSFFIVYGQTFVKVSHCIEETSSEAPSWSLSSKSNQPRWRRPDGKWRKHTYGSKTYAFAGWSMFAIGNLMRFVSMRFAAQTVLSGLGSLQFVIIPIASRYLLGIKPEITTVVGVGVVLFGNLLIILYGPPETPFTLRALRHQWTTPAMQGFLLALFSSLVALHITWRVIHKHRRLAEAEQRALLHSDFTKQHRQRGMSPTNQRSYFNKTETESLLETTTTATTTVGDRDIKLDSDLLNSTLPLSPEDPSTLRMFSAALLFSAVSSFVGAWSVLFSKSLTYVVGGAPGSLSDWYSWFTILAFIGTAAYWIRQSNKGLKLYPATLIMPLMQAFWMAMSVLEGMIYFDEMRTLSSGTLFLLIVGLVLAIMGAVAMGLAGYFNEHRPTHHHHQHAQTRGNSSSSSPTYSGGGGGGGGGPSKIMNTESSSAAMPAMHAALPPALHVAHEIVVDSGYYPLHSSKDSGLPLYDTRRGVNGVELIEVSGRIESLSGPPTLRDKSLLASVGGGIGRDVLVIDGSVVGNNLDGKSPSNVVR